MSAPTEAKIRCPKCGNHQEVEFKYATDPAERELAVRAAVLAEREACADLCDQHLDTYNSRYCGYRADIAAKIRERP